MPLPAPSLRESVERRRAVWSFAAALVVSVLVGAGVLAWAAGTRPEAVGTGPVGTVPVTSRGPDALGPGPTVGLDQVVVLMQQRLDALGIDGATVELRDPRVVVTLPEGVDRDRVAHLLDPASIEFRPVLQSLSATVGPATPSGSATGMTLAPDATGVIDDGTYRYQVAPSALSGGVASTLAAPSPQNGRWVLTMLLEPGPTGIDAFNEVAAACYRREPRCPEGQLAIVVDGTVVSAPMINADHFERDQIEISGNFTKEAAEALAAQMRSGDLPVELRFG